MVSKPMKPYYAVLDSTVEVAAIAVQFSGDERHVAAIFLREDDALEVALATELATGKPHLVVPIVNGFTRQHTPPLPVS